MSVATQRRPNDYYLERTPVRRLTEVMALVLDKGLIIDAYARLSLAGTALVTIDSRVVIASVDTYLRFAEAISRLDLDQPDGKDRSQDLARERRINAAHDVRTDPQLDGRALAAVEPHRDPHCGMKSQEPTVAARAPGIGHIRPYDWKDPRATDLLR
ncbi:MAG: gas vesicle protein [Mycobacterium sp.]|nr:gas vesicle protein [Mycobacterium sp.]